MIKYGDFLRQRIENGGFSTEDVLASFLPLVRETLETHAAGSVAPFEGIDSLYVDHARIWFEQAQCRPLRRNEPRIREIERANWAAVEVVHQTRLITDVDEGKAESFDLDIGTHTQPIDKQVYLPGYVAWEHTLEHHDPVTDIFSLGMILASLACGLDLRDSDDLQRFVLARRNLFALNAGLHPVLAQAIFRMTHLDRHRRAQDLPALLAALENYRDQPVEFEFDLARIQGFHKKDLKSKEQHVLSKLRDRLFELTRRNRLLHFQPTMQTVNLTQASVPLSFDIRNVRPDQILIWNKHLHDTIVAGRPISLNKHLNFAEAIYLPSLLDRILADSRRDEAEFGFVQLRLAVCFLYWTNLKASPVEHYDSPLILLPVRLSKKKGIRDSYVLDSLSSEAEINPVIRHQFKQLYNIDLPESIDLANTNLDQFFDYLQAKIQSSEPAVTLDKIDRPRIDLIYEKARRRLDQYRRRAKIAGRGVRTFCDIQYSYDPANYHPLGVKLYSAKVRPPATSLRTVVEDKPRPRTFAVPKSKASKVGETSSGSKTAAPVAAKPAAPSESPPTVEAERSLFTLRDGREQNPYLWSFDLCTLTLANFRYRKMSLVRDYESLLTDMPRNPAFEATFSLTPRPALRDLPAALPLDKRFDVVPCDPTQAMAIAEARAGKCYIIQGPPGTGKSQTIANLIADFAARGKRVLFVCEKRAAIDVVYARLRQRGLASLCCLIHDSQADKKAFVMDLKNTYESLVETPQQFALFPDEGGEGEEDIGRANDKRGRGGKGAPAGKGRRAEVLKRLKTELRSLERFDQAMQESPPSVGIPLRQLLDRCIELRGQLPELDALARERLPDHADWWNHRERVARFANSLSDVQPDGVLARHPLRLLSPRLADQQRPMELIVRTAESARQHLRRLQQTIEQARLPSETYETIGRLRQLLDYAATVAPVAQLDRMALLDGQSEMAREFAQERSSLHELHEAWETACEGSQGWRQKLPRDEVTSALQQVRAFQQTRWAWLQPSWWRLRGVLNRCYDFQSHLVRPSWWQVLQRLEDEHAALAAREQRRADVTRRWGLATDIEQFAAQVVAAQTLVQDLPPWLAEVYAQWSGRGSNGGANVAPGDIVRVQLPLLLDARPAAEALVAELAKIADHLDHLRLDDLNEELPAIETALDCLPDFLACLTELAALPPAVATALRELPLSVEQFEAAVAHEAIQRVYRADRTLARFNAASRDREATRLEEHYADWLDANAAEVRRLVGERFIEHLRLGESNTRLTARQSDRKRSYDRGRRELMHEFGKTMRYKAIRDLVAGDSGEVVKDLKPVWLMSPLSVSDTLPLDADHFDVVIFDEASQITLEEAVPCLFRAGQAIVVGDEMQLPPTNFFSSRRAADDEEDENEEEPEEEAEAIEYDLTSDSFLNHAAKNLASTMLGWHYRSRSESLISFSNWAFYEGRLLTAPEEEIAQPVPPLEATTPEQTGANGDELLRRAISFHHLPEAVYENRRNRLEADYIAHLVRGLLVRRTGQSIAVVAFSEAQQDEIEQALQRLAQQDAEFRDLLEAEWEREEDGQFIGLLVKNLENIQGDERDVVILSVCYARGPTGRMLMNFGPINKSGGERRLNVAFTRAKRHMAIISSIRGDAITNDYNDGANCLKNYLRYAEAVSAGDMPAARRVLHSLSRWREQQGDRRGESPLAAELAAALLDRGYLVDRDVGQSHFRCALAVRREGDARYRLGILLDDEAYYEQDDLLERDMMRPKLLRDFGWHVAHVLAKDWHDDPQQVLAAILKRLDHGST